MKKIQLFNAPTIATLQIEINEWLADNKEAHLIESNMTSLSNVNISGTVDIVQAQYAFYILYSPADESEQESILAAEKQQMPSELIDPRTIIAEIN
ncbi:hypothetical protein ADIARSV_2940 [Arcticibacter svalbardensis MN12-7]|uniref:Uncharacterized protein n=1 Tax=Arcticibacter svalbardensis MN12-7 TaxID=1150600 RepID=R9GQ29_9SPHI|nr:hypothetical protein [Arcticibacter svalbardensis]EOR93947.1 hypothetical protein ADIARSV_2940 [Arcticibacter svalbardensis MN12-7]